MPSPTMVSHSQLGNLIATNDNPRHIIDHARHDNPHYVDHAPRIIIDQISSGHSLHVNESITSFNEKYKLLMQVDGNLVLYRMSDMQNLWETATRGSGAVQVVMQRDGNLVLYTDGSIPYQGPEIRTNANPSSYNQSPSGISTQAYIIGQQHNPIFIKKNSVEGNLLTQSDNSILAERKANVVWTSETNKKGSFLKLQNDGNLVIFSGTTSKWTSNSWAKLAQQKIPERYAEMNSA